MTEQLGFDDVLRRGARGDLTDVGGVAVGHHTRLDEDVLVETADGTPGSGWAAGTTVVLFPEGSIGAVDVRGGGPGTRETDAMAVANTVERIDAVSLTGGSAFGLATADGVMAWLAERGRGLQTGSAPGQVVPLVPAAVIYDLPVGDWAKRPDAAFGAAAAEAAAEAPFARGSVGAGTGARAGSLKGGVGTASVVITRGPAAGVTVGALVVVNPLGAVVDPHTGWPFGRDPELALAAAAHAELERFRALEGKAGSPGALNTTIGVVATDAPLGKAALSRVATAAHDGLARAINPVHTPLDGDTLFAVSTGRAAVEPVPELPVGMPADLAVRAAVSAAAPIVVERAVVDAIISAAGVGSVPAYRDVFPTIVHGMFR